MSLSERATVISLHGIRTRGAWQESLARILGYEGFAYEPWKFGFFHAIGMVNPSARRRKIEWFLEKYTRLSAETSGPISIVAHSFGSYLLAASLREYPQIRFDKIILCGSIIEVDYDWNSIIEKRKQANAVLNQYGKRDFWVRLAQWVVADAGPSGYEGFSHKANGKVHQQLFEDYSHSQYFYDLNFKNYWLPFLKGEEVEQSINLTKSGPNWRFRVLVVTVLIAMFCLIYWMYDRPVVDPQGFPLPTTAASLASQQDGSVAQNDPTIAQAQPDGRSGTTEKEPAKARTAPPVESTKRGSSEDEDQLTAASKQPSGPSLTRDWEAVRFDSTEPCMLWVDGREERRLIEQYGGMWHRNVLIKKGVHNFKCVSLRSPALETAAQTVRIGHTAVDERLAVKFTEFVRTGLAPGAPVTEAKELTTSSATLTSAVLGAELTSSNEIAAPRSTFAPFDDIHLRVLTDVPESVSYPVTVGVNWSYVHEGEEMAIRSQSFELFSSGVHGSNFQISRPEDWPDGVYWARVFVDGRLEKELQFTVR